MLNKQIITKNNEIVRLKKFETAHSSLVSDTASLGRDNRSYKVQINKNNNRINGLVKNNKELKKAFEQTLTLGVGNIVNSLDFNTPKTEELLTKCKSHSKLLTSSFTNPLVSKLTKYKTLCEVMSKSKQVLAKKIDKNEVNIALNLLKKSSGNKKQNDYIKLYKTLLQNYCKVSNRAEYKYSIAHEYRRNAADKCRKTLRIAINQIHPYYTYVIRELEKKKSNTMYVCKLSKCN